jgi:hypothetical protein
LAFAKAANVIPQGVSQAAAEEPVRVGNEEVYAAQVQVVPELAAQINGYVRSERWDRSEPKFMIIDIGGGTLDAAIFNVVEASSGPGRARGGRGFHFLGALVEPLGSVVLHRERLDWWLEHLPDGPECPVGAALEDMRAVPSTQVMVLHDAADYVLDAEIMGDTVDDDFFAKYANKLWRELIHPVRSKSDPKSGQWSKLPLLICGGARRLRIYGRYVSTLNNDPSRHVNLVRFENEAPSSLRAPGLPSNDFHRLSVAYGLSFFETDAYIGSSDIEPMLNGVSSDGNTSGSAYVSKDQI